MKKHRQDELLKRADDMVTELGLERQALAVQVAVAVDGRTVYSRAFGYGDLENRVRYTTRTRAKVASVSKLFATHALMRALHDHWRRGMTSGSRGKHHECESQWLLRNLTVHDILVDFPKKFYLYDTTQVFRRRRMEDFGWAKWRVGNNLNIPAIAFLVHTVGTSHYLSSASLEGDYLRFEHASAAYEHLLDTKKLHVLHKIYPGKNTKTRLWCAYTSYGTVMTGAMVERLQHLDYHRYLAQLTCGEMNLRDTFSVDCQDSDSCLVDYATGYSLEEDELIGGQGHLLIKEYHRDHSMMHAPEGVASTALDLVKFGSVYAHMYRNKSLKPPDSPLPASTVYNDMFALFGGNLATLDYESHNYQKHVHMGIGWTLEESVTCRHHPPLKKEKNDEEEEEERNKKKNKKKRNRNEEEKEKRRKAEEERLKEDKRRETGVAEWMLDAFHLGQAVAGTSALRVRLTGEPKRKLGRFHPDARWGPEEDKAESLLERNRLLYWQVKPKYRQHMADEDAEWWSEEIKVYSPKSKENEEEFEEERKKKAYERERQINTGIIEPWQITRDVAHHQQQHTTTSCLSRSRKTVVVAIIAQLRNNLLEDLSRDLATLFETYDESLD